MADKEFNPADLMPMLPQEGPPLPRLLKDRIPAIGWDGSFAGDEIISRIDNTLQPPGLPRLANRTRASALRNALAHDTIGLGLTGGSVAAGALLGWPTWLVAITIGTSAAVAADVADNVFESKCKEALTPEEREIYDNHDDIPRTIALFYAFGTKKEQ